MSKMFRLHDEAALKDLEARLKSKATVRRNLIDDAGRKAPEAAKRQKSKPEADMLALIVSNNLPDPKTEFQFHPVRKWRFDFCWPERMLALELEGAVFANGRHTRGSGFVADCEKYAEAALLGWKVLRVPAHWVREGKALELLRRALGELSTECSGP